MRAIELYWRKFSGPLLDRIDLRVSVQDVKSSLKNEVPFSTEELRLQIKNAVRIQRLRGKKNAFLNSEEIEKYCALQDYEKQFFEQITKKADFSQRAIASCKKIARTIADMKEKESIGVEELEEAVSFRKNSGPLESVCALEV